MNLSQNARVMRQANNYVSQSTAKELRVRPFSADAIVFAKVGAAISLERKRIAPSPFLIDNNLMAFTPKEKEDLEFIYHLFQRLRLSKYCKVGALPSYNASDILAISTFYPSSNSERKKIVSILNLIHDRIEVQSEMIVYLKKYKRGLLEAFLTKKIRFSNNGSPYEDWKWVTLSEIGEFFGGLSGKTKEDFGHGTDSFITYMNVYKNTFATSDGIMPVSIKPSEKQNHIQYGDVLFTQSSETVEEVGLSSVWLHKSRPYLNSFCMALRPYDLAKINSMYLGYVLRSQAVREQIMKEGQGISRINLSGSRILNVGFWMPSYAEQNKIVDVLMRLDEICRISSEKLSELSVMKSSIMQQLFI